MTSLSAKTAAKSQIMLGAVLMWLFGCDGNSVADPDSVAVRDSAGVQIVESVTPQWEQARWRLSDRPTIEIGRADGDPMYLLHQIVGAARLPDGTIVVANGGDNSLRFYDETGGYVRSVGGTGNGPGEFSALSLLITQGDSIWASSPAHLFRRDGTFRQLSFEGRRTLRGVFGDGTLLVEQTDQFPREPERTFWQTKTYSSLGGADSIAADVTLPFLKWGVVSGGDISLLLLSPVAHEAVASDVFYHGWPETFDISVFDQELRLVRRIRRGFSSPQVNAEAIDSVIDILIEGEQGDPNADLTALRQLYMSLPAAETIPAHGALAADSEGYLWVQRFTLDGYARTMLASRLMPPVEGVMWDIFDPDGVWLGSVPVPAGFMPLHIGESFVLGVHYDSFGLESVRLYDLDRAL